MKKILTSLTILSMTLSAHAVVLGWDFSNGTSWNGENYTAAEVKNAGVVIIRNNGSNDVTQSYNANNGVVGGNGLGSKDGTQGLSGYYGNVSSGESYFIVLFDRDDPTKALISGSLVYSTDGSDGFMNNATVDTAQPPAIHNTFNPINGLGGSWNTAVPEPTSMALLMLGIAAVGLRRKVRKSESL